MQKQIVDEQTPLVQTPSHIVPSSTDDPEEVGVANNTSFSFANAVNNVNENIWKWNKFFNLFFGVFFSMLKIIVEYFSLFFCKKCFSFLLFCVIIFLHAHVRKLITVNDIHIGCLPGTVVY